MKLVNLDAIFLKNCTVLFVDHDKESRIQVSQYLSQQILNVITVDCATQALKAYHKLHPDIVIIGLKIRNGFKMIEEIREVDATIPVVLLIAHDDVEYLKRAINMGLDTYITIPIDTFQFQSVLLKCSQRLRIEKQIKNHQALLQDLLQDLLQKLTKIIESSRGSTRELTTPFEALIDRLRVVLLGYEFNDLLTSDIKWIAPNRLDSTYIE